MRGIDEQPCGASRFPAGLCLPIRWGRSPTGYLIINSINHRISRFSLLWFSREFHRSLTYSCPLVCSFFTYPFFYDAMLFAHFNLRAFRYFTNRSATRAVSASIGRLSCPWLFAELGHGPAPIDPTNIPQNV